MKLSASGVGERYCDGGGFKGGARAVGVPVHCLGWVGVRGIGGASRGAGARDGKKWEGRTVVGCLGLPW